jgi:hypothetical protein
VVDQSSGVIALPDVPALKIVGDVRALNLQSEHDVIVLSIRKDVPITKAEVESIIEMWKQVTRLPNPVVCLVDGIDVSVTKVGGTK